MKTPLNEYPWESMRSPEEIREDEDRQRHNDGYCEGPPMCWWCQEAKEDAENFEKVAQRTVNKLDACAYILADFERAFEVLFKEKV